MKLKLVDNKFMAVMGQMRDALQNAAIESTQAMFLDAVENVPVDTGNLRATHEVVDGERANAVDAVSTGPLELTFAVQAGGPTEEAPEGADYTQHVHDGTLQMPPRPWLEQAAENESKSYAERFRQHIESEVTG